MNAENLDPQLLQPKQHLLILDGLRGIAALAIVIFHFMEWIFPEGPKNFIGHAFLAVDFFFCLSGFVIAYAYDNRMTKIGVMEFFKKRLIRLHPLVIAGSVLGLLGFLFDPFESSSLASDPGKLLLMFACSLLLIPLPIMEERFFNLFSFNAPAWSLFWEYVANIIYALVLCRLNRRVLLALAVIASAGIGWISYDAGNLLGGWNGDTFWHGGVRVAYSFLAGMLIYRSGWIIRNKLGFIGLAVLLSLAFVMPFFSWNWLAEAIVVLIYFPILVSLGAGASLSPRLTKICVFSGQLSYPLYMTHYFAIWIFGHYYTTQKPPASELVWVIIAGVILLVGFAYIVMRWFELPVRRWLSNRKSK
jgi:peptidoglycan/LPS O-acetylase OafA/YrhL